MIRFAAENDIPAIRALFELCFPDDSGFNDYFFAHLFRPERTLLLEQGGALCAMVQMLPYTLSTGEATYIYGACTHPAHRRKHLMARLLEYSFAEDRRRERVGSFLIPQEEWLFDFYAPFGYQPVFTLDSRKITRGQAPAADLRPLNGFAEAAALYERRTADESLRVLRTSENWQAQIDLFASLGAGAFGLYENDCLTAYAFVWHGEDGGLFAQELIAEDEEQADTLCQALLHQFDKETISYGTAGGTQRLGCFKPYAETAPTRGYINLMLN